MFNHLLTTAILLSATVVASTAIEAGAQWVDDDACPGPGSGTASDPFCSIQAAYDAAAHGDEVRVRPGTYHECVRANDPVTGKTVSFVADAFDPETPDTQGLTTIDGGGIPGCAPYSEANPVLPVRPVLELGGVGSSVSGFRIVGGGASGVRARGSVTITHNLVEGNKRDGVGGGILILTDNCAYGDTMTVISNNVIRANRGLFSGGGIWARAGRDRFAHPPNTPCPGEGDAVLSIVDNLLEQNTTLESGAGMQVLTYATPGFSTEVVITRNTIMRNRAVIFDWPNGSSDAWGGGIYAATYGGGEETIRVFGNTVQDNHADSSGGGISAFVGTNRKNDAVRHQIVVEDNVVRGNSTGWGGGGMELWVGAEEVAPPISLRLLARNNLVENNVVLDNVEFWYAPPGGGGVTSTVYSERSSAESLSLQITGNVIRNNTSHRWGGGISAEAFAFSGPDGAGTERPAEAWMEITGNLIYSNGSRLGPTYREARGGGAHLNVISVNDDADSGIAFWLNTVADNRVENAAEAGGVHIAAGTGTPWTGFTAGRGHVELSSNIIASNQGFGVDVTPPVIVPAAADKGYNTHLTVGVTYSDVVSNAAGNYGNWLGDLTGLFGNESVDPAFVDAPTGDYHLRAGSPLIDAGDPVVRPSTPDSDADGDPRIFDGSADGAAIVDMGYDEWVPQPIEVAIDIKPGDAGNSINPRSRGMIPVAVLATADFDVSTVDMSSVRFGPGSAPGAHSPEGHFEDVNADGLVDLVLHFRTQLTGIVCDDASVALEGRAVDGVPLHGMDAITTVGCSGGGRARSASEETAERRAGQRAVNPRPD